MAKSTVRKDIKEAKAILKEIMQGHLVGMAEGLIEQIMKNYRNATPAQRVNAAKDVEIKGTALYNKEMLVAMAIIAADSLAKAKKEVPEKSKVKLSEWDEDALSLGEFEKLPPKVKKRLKNQAKLLVNTQAKDLEKVILYQFSSSVDSTDSESLIRSDIYESAEGFITGPSIEAGSGIVGARVINEARFAFFFDDEVLDGIEAFEFRNDVPETPICDDLNGKVFSADDPGFQRYTPPLHYNCDSYILPILKGNLRGREIEPLRPSDPELDKYVQFRGRDHECSGQVCLAEI